MRREIVRTMKIDKVDYRLLAGGHSDPSYRDEYLLQKREDDEVGGDRWVTVVRASKSADRPAECEYLMLRIIEFGARQ